MAEPVQSDTQETAAAGGSAPGVVQVLLPMPLAGAYDYSVPDGLSLAVGDFVEVPLGPRRLVGVVWGTEAAEVAATKLKPVRGRLPVASLPKPMIAFVNWVAAYTVTPPGGVLRLALRGFGDGVEPKPQVLYRASGQAPARMTPARLRVLEALKGGLALAGPDLAERAGVSSGVVRGLVDASALAIETRPVFAPFDPPIVGHAPPVLNEAQAAAAGVLADLVDPPTHETVLLDGVTGSGKTEVYFEAAAKAFAAGQQVLILLPEIALTLQIAARFEARFGVVPALWHSDLKQSERRRVWRAVLNGEAQVVIGARSALFLPFRALGLIVVDEEHDATYKQDDGVRYNARDMAVVRGHTTGIPVVLASATPSLETHVNADTGRYRRLVLAGRFGSAGLPDIRLVDMRADGPERQRWVSAPLEAAVRETVAVGEQALLFLNRRGYAPLTLCRACGHRMQCPTCDSWLVHHRFRDVLACHHCGYSRPMPAACPACAAEDKLAACGPGVERLAEEAVALFPEARIEILSSDLIDSVAAARELFERVKAGAVDLMIGTQLVAKGHHFPKLTLVGVVDADLGLSGGDLRAGERTYQLLDQVGGRAGRAERPGRVLLQTYMPEHPVMQALQNRARDAFVASELEGRRMLHLPPYGRLAGLILSAPDEARGSAFAQMLAQRAPVDDAVQMLGPAPAPIARLRGRYRIRFLLKAQKAAHLQAYIRAWLGDVTVPSWMRMAVDIDPYSFL